MVVLLLFGTIGVTAILSSGTHEDYQTDRLKVFADPEGMDEQVRYNLAQAQITISSGGMLGVGEVREHSSTSFLSSRLSCILILKYIILRDMYRQD